MIAAIATTLFFTYAEPAGSTEALAREAITWQKPCYTLDDAANSSLIEIGFTPIKPERWPVP